MTPKNTQLARDILENMGVPVLDPDNNDHFSISAEENDDVIWADYYNPCFGDFGVNAKITKVLDAHGLFCEWINPAKLGVYDI